MGLLSKFRSNQRAVAPVRASVQDLVGTAESAIVPFDARVQGSAMQGTLQVALYRPPVVLDAQGRTAPGVTREMVANHLAATVARMTDVQLGPVNVQWAEAQGRFVRASYEVPTFNVRFEVVHPAGTIDQSVADVLDQYMAGICLKVLEMMKGHQRYDNANRLIRRSHQRLEFLRDVSPPVLTTPEYLFLDTQISKALVLSALPHLPAGGGEPIVGQMAAVA